MRRSQGQVFVLAPDKVADSHTRGSHWRKMHKMQLMSMLRSKETIDGKFQVDRTPSASGFWLLVVSFPPPYLNINKADLKNLLHRPSLPPYCPRSSPRAFLFPLCPPSRPADQLFALLLGGTRRLPRNTGRCGEFSDL